MGMSSRIKGAVAACVLFSLCFAAVFFSTEKEKDVLREETRREDAAEPASAAPAVSAEKPDPPPAAPSSWTGDSVPHLLAAPLRQCIRSCSQPDLMAFILENGVDAHMRWREGRIFTVFDSLARSRPESALLLLRTGRVITTLCPQALSSAVISGHTELVRLLLDLGADPNGQEAHGPSPFTLAVTLGHVEIMHLLETSGSRVDTIYQKKTVMDLAARSRLVRTTGLKHLVASGFSIEPHHVASAVRHGGLGALAFMLKQRPDLRKLDYGGKDLLSLAILWGRPPSMVRYLHRTGCLLTPEHLALALSVREAIAPDPDTPPSRDRNARHLDGVILYIEQALNE